MCCHHLRSQRGCSIPYKWAGLPCPNAIVMAPLTRMGVSNTDMSPTALHATYYAHRATAGLIVTEGASISREAVGWADTPGLWSRRSSGGRLAGPVCKHQAGANGPDRLSRREWAAGTREYGSASVTTGIRHSHAPDPGLVRDKCRKG